MGSLFVTSWFAIELVVQSIQILLQNSRSLDLTTYEVLQGFSV